MKKLGPAIIAAFWVAVQIPINIASTNPRSLYITAGVLSLAIFYYTHLLVGHLQGSNPRDTSASLREPEIAAKTPSRPIPTPEPELSELTPGHILSTIQASKDLEQESVGQTFVGAKVRWQLGLLSIKTSKQQIARMHFDTGKKGEVVAVIDLRENDFVRAAKRGQMFIVSGTVSSADSLGILLEDCSIRRAR